MKKYYQGTKQLKEERWRHNRDYVNQNSLSDRVDEFSPMEKEIIFNNVYSCIDMFYQLFDDKISLDGN